MKKPKEIKVIFLLAFLFTMSFAFSQESKIDSVKPSTKKKPLVFKYGISYLPDRKFSSRYYAQTVYGGFQNPIIRIYEQVPANIFGPYIGIGVVSQEVKYFSIYMGAYYTNARAEFSYSKSLDTRLDPVLPLYKVRYEKAKGYIILHSLGFELNFHADIKRSRIIISPFNPSIVFSNFVTTEKRIIENEVIRKYNNGQSDSTISIISNSKGEFNMDARKILLGFSNPICLGFEQRIRLKKRTMLIGFKATILLKRYEEPMAGGLLYTGFEF